MFELTKDLLDKIGRAIMPDAELVPVGPHFEASCARALAFRHLRGAFVSACGNH